MGGCVLCADYKVTLNRVIKVHHYPLPKFDDIVTRVGSCKYYCVIDLSNAFLQLKLASDSKQLMTVNTHKGLYQYDRLGYGVAAASAIFQGVMDQVLRGISFVSCYVDDLMFGGNTLEECYQRARVVMQRLSAHNIKINGQNVSFLKLKLSI